MSALAYTCLDTLTLTYIHTLVHISTYTYVNMHIYTHTLKKANLTHTHTMLRIYEMVGSVLGT